MSAGDGSSSDRRLIGAEAVRLKGVDSGCKPNRRLPAVPYDGLHVSAMSFMRFVHTCMATAHMNTCHDQRSQGRTELAALPEANCGKSDSIRSKWTPKPTEVAG
jgi:hypothetical protein